MPRKKKEEIVEETPSPIILSKELNQDYLLQLSEDILEHFKKHAALELDCSEIDAMNTAALQAFISINQYAQDHDKSVKWLTPNSHFIDAFNNIGLYSEMMKMEIVNG